MKYCFSYTLAKPFLYFRVPGQNAGNYKVLRAQGSHAGLMCEVPTATCRVGVGILPAPPKPSHYSHYNRACEKTDPWSLKSQQKGGLGAAFLSTLSQAPPSTMIYRGVLFPLSKCITSLFWLHTTLLLPVLACVVCVLSQGEFTVSL